MSPSSSGLKSKPSKKPARNRQQVSCWFLVWLTLRLWGWRGHVPPKHRLTFNGLHGVISEEKPLKPLLGLVTSKNTLLYILYFEFVCRRFEVQRLRSEWQFDKLTKEVTYSCRFTVYTDRSLVSFRRNLLPLSARLKNKPRVKKW
jgi:hypothetical protein